VSQVGRYLEPALVEHLNHMSLSARSVVQGGTIGQHRSPIKGASVEFRQHRFYVPGDEPRRLDWRVLGRTDRPYVKEYDEETNLRAVLLLDASGSMGYGRGGEFGSKFDYAARLLAAFSYLMLGQSESVGVTVCRGDGDEWLAPHSGPTHLSRIVEALERVAPSGATALPRAMHEVADRLERRGLVIILSDFFAASDELRAGLAHLRHERHEVVAVRVLDRNELEFPFRNWTRFRGMEGERGRLVEPALARRAYKENFERHRREMEAACLALRVDLIQLVTDRGILEAIRRFMMRR
jgi:uncharacterized protein (DUF58 family)